MSSMHNVLGGVVMSNPSPTFGASVRSCIDEAKQAAQEAVACGESIRWVHVQGCTNSSRCSTVDGAVSTARSVIRLSLDEESEKDDSLFGNNLRRAWRVIKPLIRR